MRASEDLELTLSREEVRLRQRLLSDYEFYAFSVLKIKDKINARSREFKFNDSQKYSFQRADKQLRETGKVRQVRLKARQEGCSTGIQGRQFFYVSTRDGVHGFTMAHNEATTNALFSMSKNFYERMPESIKPKLSKCNASEISFAHTKSSMFAATAGESTQGRGTTNHFLHASEVAYWAHGENHISGILNSVPSQGHTEVYIESTANGTDNIFYTLWQLAAKDKAEFEAIFTPWFWNRDYFLQYPFDSNIELDDEEKDYRKQYDLELGQMYWRRNVININNSKSRDGRKEFDREYPASPSVAFSVARANTFIPMSIVNAACLCKEVPPYDKPPKYIGFDVAAQGNDFNAIIFREGRVMHSPRLWQSSDTMASVAVAAEIIKKTNPDAVFIDSIGIGKGVFDRLREMFGKVIVAVNVAESAILHQKYYNKRTENWAVFKDWLSEPPCMIPDDESLKIAIGAVEYEHDSNNRLKLCGKDVVRKALGHSPDLADAAALTFSRPPQRPTERRKQPPRPDFI